MMKNPHPARRRVYMLLGFFGAFLLLFFAVLYDAQVVHGSENRAKSITSNTASETVTASRGIITDRNGKVLVSNRLAYTLVFDKSAFGKDDGALNDAIWRLIQLCQELDVPWNDTLPLTTGVIHQLKTAARSNAFQEYLKDNELPENASASELIGALRELYASNNPVREIDLSIHENVEIVELQDMPVLELINLKNGYCSDWAEYYIVQGNTSLKKVIVDPGYELEYVSGLFKDRPEVSVVTE